MENLHKGRIPICMVAEKEVDLLSRHIDILKNVRDHGPIGIIRLSQLTGQPQHVIRYSLRTLEHTGIIKPSAHGAMVTEKLDAALEQLNESLDQMISTMTVLKKALR